jgi:hypothetical protein
MYCRIILRMLLNFATQEIRLRPHSYKPNKHCNGNFADNALLLYGGHRSAREGGEMKSSGEK